MPVLCAKDAKITLLIRPRRKSPLGSTPRGKPTGHPGFLAPRGTCAQRQVWGTHNALLENRMSMADRDGKIWMDGKLIDWRDAKIHVLTHTLHYGMGVFEGVRAYKTAAGGT